MLVLCLLMLTDEARGTAETCMSCLLVLQCWLQCAAADYLTSIHPDRDHQYAVETVKRLAKQQSVALSGAQQLTTP